MNENIRLAKAWIQKAESDLLNADNNLASSVIPYDTVCFHCQQAAEKYLKAFLVYRNIVPPQTHDLLRLLEMILPLSPLAESLRLDLALLMPYAVEIRYPDDFQMPESSDTKEARAAVTNVKVWLTSDAKCLFSSSHDSV